MTDTPADKQIELQLELAQKEFEQECARINEELKNTHIKKEYTFSNLEKRRLVEMQMALLVTKQAIEDIINLDVLKRLGYTPSNELKVYYDFNIGRFVVFVPKQTNADKLTTPQ